MSKPDATLERRRRAHQRVIDALRGQSREQALATVLGWVDLSFVEATLAPMLERGDPPPLMTPEAVEHLRAMIMLVEAAGGEIRVLPRHAYRVPSLELRKFTDEGTQAVVLQTREKKT